MKLTSKYQLAYFEQGDRTRSVPEMRRWVTLDNQLYSLFQIIGNGILGGWDFVESTGLSIGVSSGSGHVNFVAVESVETVVLDGLTPNTTNYIYASLVDDSYWTKDVAFQSFINLQTREEYLYLGYIVTDDEENVIEINQDGRQQLGFVGVVRDIVSTHRHVGGEGNPEPVDLASEVQGVINQRNLPDLDADIIKSGTLDADRIPPIDHLTKVTNQGTLTHSQLDSFVSSLSILDNTLMGETSTTNLLKLILAVKHVYPEIDDYLINEIAYIPGISPDSYVDWQNTTAEVDTRTYAQGGGHTIGGSTSTGIQAYTKIWNTTDDFEVSDNSNVYINGDQVQLETTSSSKKLDAFAEMIELEEWEIVTDEVSNTEGSLSVDSAVYVSPPYSAKVNLLANEVEISMELKKTFDPEDWSNYRFIRLSIYTESVEHGDIYFFIKDAFYGEQGSATKVLDRNAPSINNDTLEPGWQEVIIDISDYRRGNIVNMGFRATTDSGWDPAKGLLFNVDDIYLETGNQYLPTGYMRLTFGSDFMYDFWRVRWDAIIPTDSQSTGLDFKWRTRVSDTEAGLQASLWSSYSSVSGSDILLAADSLYKYIEIEVYFGASTSLLRSAILKSLMLDFYVRDVENSFNYDSQDDWESGTLYNVDTTTIPGAMKIDAVDDVGNIYYGSDGNAQETDENFTSLFNISGTKLPKTPYQVAAGAAPSLGQISGVSRGSNGNIWVCDTENDRVVELDKSGNVVRYFFGVHFEEKEEDADTDTANAAIDGEEEADSLEVSSVMYNPADGSLYIVFNRDAFEPTISTGEEATNG